MKSPKVTTTLRIFLFLISLILILNFLTLVRITQQHPPQQQHLPHTPTPQDHCHCVDCYEDQLCGGLWRANRFPDMPSNSQLHRTKIRIVVSHCNKSLDWMEQYTSGFAIASIHIVSKCGVDVRGAPDGAIVQRLSNVGREGHSFAYYISSILPTIIASPSEEATVVFLKDSVTDKIYQGSEFRRLDFPSLVRLASSENGFGCGLGVIGGSGTSAFHDKATLSQFNLSWYGKGETDYKEMKQGEDAERKIPFESSYANLGSFLESLPIPTFLEQEPDIVPVCYAGIFSASVTNIYRHELHVWEALQHKLERGDNIQEGHFVERTWARLLSTPLKPYQVEALRGYATGVRRNIFSVHGPLIRKASEIDVTYMNLNAYRGEKPLKKGRKMISVV